MLAPSLEIAFVRSYNSAGQILGHNFDERGRFRELVIKRDGRCDAALYSGSATLLHQLLDIELAENRTQYYVVQTVGLAGVQFQSAVRIVEDKSIEGLATAVRERFGLQNVHAETGQRAGEGGQQKRAVLGDAGTL